jgi:hypothetical protein
MLSPSCDKYFWIVSSRVGLARVRPEKLEYAWKLIIRSHFPSHFSPSQITYFYPHQLQAPHLHHPREHTASVGIPRSVLVPLSVPEKLVINLPHSPIKHHKQENLRF